MQNNQIEFLLERCKRNDSRAQMQLYDKYASAMYKVAQRYVKDTFIAEDVLQDSFIKMFKKMEQYNATVSFGAWLKRIVINTSIDYLKKEKHLFVSIVSDEIEYEEVEEFSFTERIEKVKEALHKLKDKDRVILQLFWIEGYTHEEIAGILKISINTSRTQLSRAKEKLKNKLQSYVNIK